MLPNKQNIQKQKKGRSKKKVLRELQKVYRNDKKRTQFKDMESKVDCMESYNTDTPTEEAIMEYWEQRIRLVKTFRKMNNILDDQRYVSIKNDVIKELQRMDRRMKYILKNISKRKDLNNKNNNKH